MGEIELGARQQRFPRVAERPFECRVYALEMAVEPDHAQEVERHLENPLCLEFGVLTPPLQLAERGHRVVHTGEQLRPHALEPAHVGPVLEPVLPHRAVLRADLVDQPCRRAVNLAKGAGDVSDLVPAGVVDPSRDVTVRQTSRSGRHVPQRPCDRAPQSQG